MIKNTPAGNLLLSAAILFAGALPNKMLRVLEFLHCASIAPCTFYTHQRLYLNPVINNVWKRSQSEMIMLLQAYNDPLSIGGDGRSDSPGHLAKYGSYTFMDVEHNVILNLELVQVTLAAFIIILELLLYNMIQSNEVDSSCQRRRPDLLSFMYGLVYYHPHLIYTSLLWLLL